MYVLSWSGAGTPLGETYNELVKNAHLKEQPADIYETAAKTIKATCGGLDCTKTEWNTPSPISSGHAHPWQPAGTVDVLSWFPELGLSMAVTDFFDKNGNAKSNPSTTIPKSKIGTESYKLFAYRILEKSKTMWRETAWGKGELSLNSFQKQYPDYVTNYRGIELAIKPTLKEKLGKLGVSSFYARGGFLISKSLLDGSVPFMTRTGLFACGNWCLGCVTSRFPQGVPTCSNSFEFGDNWHVFITLNLLGDVKITLKPIDPGAWDKFWRKLNPGRFFAGLCAVAPFATISDPSGWMNKKLFAADGPCGQATKQTITSTPLPVPTHLPPPTPPPAHFLPSTNSPWFKTTKGKVGIAGGVAVVAGGILYLFAHGFMR